MASRAATLTRGRWSSFVLVAGLCSCQAGTTAPASLAHCASMITWTVDVRSSETEFDWRPRCTLTRLAVPPANVHVDIWAIEDPKGFAGPIIYGSVPAGAEELVPPGMLKAGQRYLVSGGVEQDGDLREVGLQEFTR